MGYSSWSDAAYREVASGRATAGSAEIFRADKSVDPLMDPKKLKAREARDSEHHPNSVPILVAFDVTGSMGDVPTRFARDLLGVLMKRLVEEGWVTDPQVCFAAVGDAVCDRAPLQVGQFESGLEMDMWLTRLWLEGAGGDIEESYSLAHWVAAHHTATDAWEKRGKKGYLFTIGDAPDKPLDPAQIERVFGARAAHPTDPASVTAAAAAKWEVFHVHLLRGGDVHPSWAQRLGRRVLVLDQVDAVCDLLGVVMGVTEGKLPLATGLARLEKDGVGPAALASARSALGG